MASGFKLGLFVASLRDFFLWRSNNLFLFFLNGASSQSKDSSATVSPVSWPMIEDIAGINSTDICEKSHDLKIYPCKDCWRWRHFLPVYPTEASGSGRVPAGVWDADGRVRPSLPVETKWTEEESLTFLTGSAPSTNTTLEEWRTSRIPQTTSTNWLSDPWCS